MKINSMIYVVLLTGLLLPILFCCKKEAIKVPPTVTITSMNNVASTTANSGGEVTSDGGTNVTERGVCWSVNQNPTTSDSKIANGTGLGSFTSSLTGLTPGTTYNIKAYAINSVGIGYSNQLTYTTLALVPVLTTTELSSVTSTSATSGGNITNNGGAEVTARGVCWSTTENPTITDSKTTDGTGSGSFTSSITILTPGTTYYFRAYATNSIGTAYGNQLNKTTTAILSVISTTAVSAITSVTAISGGNITNNGGAEVTARGVCWSTNQNPTIANSKTTDGVGSGTFPSSISGLNPGVTYYIRAYATNSIGTAYGDQITTTTTATLPMINTTAASAITSTTASSGGNITSDGGSPVTTRGVCYSTSQNPTILDNKTSNEAGTGSFSSLITGLLPGTIYYIRAYATNSIGTIYGIQVSATSLAILPVINTSTVSVITETTATSGATIISNSGATVTARGVCWSTSPNPTSANSKTLNGTGSGSFISNLTGLSANTTYYLRAYATNSAGTAYGNEFTFKTLPISGGTVTDIDGNVYHTVTIGTQVWMVENLKTTKYRNGEAIPNVIDSWTWKNLTTGAYGNYKLNESNSMIYGRLYNWYAVNDGRNIAPTGWHVPTYTEWLTLVLYSGGINSAGNNLKEAGISSWRSPDAGATNETGFTALPGGCLDIYGVSYNIGYNGYWWNSNDLGTNYGCYWDMNRGNGLVHGDCDKSKNYGMSIRCIRD